MSKSDKTESLIILLSGTFKMASQFILFAKLNFRYMYELQIYTSQIALLYFGSPFFCGCFILTYPGPSCSKHR